MKSIIIVEAMSGLSLESIVARIKEYSRHGTYGKMEIAKILTDSSTSTLAANLLLEQLNLSLVPEEKIDLAYFAEKEIVEFNFKPLQELDRELKTRARSLFNRLRELSENYEITIVVMKFITPLIYASLTEIAGQKADIEISDVNFHNDGPVHPGDFFIIECHDNKVEVLPGCVCPV